MATQGKPENTRQYVLETNFNVYANKRNKIINTSNDIVKSKIAEYERIFAALDLAYDDDYEHANEILNEARKINDAYYHRLARLKARVKRMCDIGCCFLTLTFDDVHLGKTSAKTRSQQVQRFLSSFDAPWCANVDYGSRNEREHYHAVICAPLEQLALTPWNKGYVYYEEVGTTRVYRSDKGIFERARKRRDDTPEKDGDRTSRYLNKLSNHAVKVTTKASRIKYSLHIDDVLCELEWEAFGGIKIDVPTDKYGNVDKGYMYKEC